MIHALACPAAAPRPTAAVVELREPHCALRPATEIGSGRARLTPSLGPLGLPPRAGSLAWLRRFFGGDSKAACRRLASQLAAHSATMGRSAISHGELAALLVDGEASMPSAWLYAPFEQQQSARSSTKPPSPLFADVCTAPPPPAIQSWRGVACGVACGVAWRVAWRVACFGPLNPLGPSGNSTIPH